MSAWWRWRSRCILRSEWRRCKRRAGRLQRNNCPTLAREVNAAADQFWAELLRLDAEVSR